jgi:hypothetical protein
VKKEGYRPEIYTLGHRNPLGLTIHPVTGEMWSTEFGPRGGDELNVIKAGANYGWNHDYARHALRWDAWRESAAGDGGAGALLGAVDQSGEPGFLLRRQIPGVEGQHADGGDDSFACCGLLSTHREDPPVRRRCSPS